MLNEHRAGFPAADLCRRHGIDATLRTRRTKYGVMDVPGARALKAVVDLVQFGLAIRG